MYSILIFINHIFQNIPYIMNNIYIYIYIRNINSSPLLFEDHQEWMGTLHRCAVKSGEIGTSPDQK